MKHCSRSPNQFDIVGADGLPLTNRDQVLEYPGAKRAVTGAFFDLAKIEKLCHKHGLEFKDRIVILCVSFPMAM